MMVIKNKKTRKRWQYCWDFRIFKQNIVHISILFRTFVSVLAHLSDYYYGVFSNILFSE